MSDNNRAHAPNQLRRDAVGVSHIVFFVVAAAAPLTAVVGVTPAAFAFGDGPGVPGVFLVVGALYLLFSVGYTAMTRHVRGAGGFYPYIASGLGKPVGVASAFIALLTYNAMDIAVYGLFGYFVRDIIVSAGGPQIHWLIYAAVMSLAVFFCGTRNIEFSGRLLGVCMVAEIGILILLGVAILLAGGPEGVNVASYASATATGPGLGVALVFVVTAFIGFEATAIFGEEARHPHITIPRATYISVIIIAILYAFATWTISIYYGPSQIAAVAKDHTDTMYIGAVQAVLGSAAALVLKVLLTTSIFACALSFHNTINRYLFAIGREGLAWTGFGRTHSRFQSPHVAGLAQTLFALGVTGLFALFGQDPYAIVFSWMGALSSLGILVLQILVCFAIIAFFRAAPRGVGVFGRLIAPGLSALGLAACLALMTANLSLVSGSESLIVEGFPVLIAVIGVWGALLAIKLRTSKPALYQTLGLPVGLAAENPGV